MRAVLSPDSQLGLLDLKVLTLMAHGLTDDEIGRRVYEARGKRETASKAVGRVIRRLGAANRTHAVALAYERGILLTGDRP